jgi:ribosomal protein S18 acetylase RimI-like enzyme
VAESFIRMTSLGTRDGPVDQRKIACFASRKPWVQIPAGPSFAAMGPRGAEKADALDLARIHVRSATRADIPSIVSIALTAIEPGEDDGFGVPGTISPFTDVGRLSVVWRDPNFLRGKEEVLVAEFAGRVVGCMTIEERDRDLELIDIDVPRELQGRGIGGRMVRSVEARARKEGKDGVTLGTSRNAAGVPWKSLEWWEHQGYRITHEEENEWTRAIGPGAREIRMRKDLR